MEQWNSLNESGKLIYLVKEGESIDVRAVKAFEMLQNDFIDHFGVSKEYQKKLRKKIEIELLELEVLHTKDKSKNVFIRIAKKELEEMENHKVHGNDSKLKMAIEKYLGFRLNLREVSVFDFYSYANELKNG